MVICGRIRANGKILVKWSQGSNLEWNADSNCKDLMLEYSGRERVLLLVHRRWLRNRETS